MLRTRNWGVRGVLWVLHLHLQQEGGQGAVGGQARGRRARRLDAAPAPTCPLPRPPSPPTQALRHYASVPGPHKHTAGELAARLRWQLLTNMVKQYERTGYVWEQYSVVGGEGKGSHPFTGWTALLVLLAADE